ncbi:HAD-IA family hydrolase [Streptomyces sp. 7N604]|uniref:HAD-IA family hydrolase n=1 Tax=Streptomyces sp. 7N604 TaxID=3457415 RepID=UPI003FD5C7F5
MHTETRRPSPLSRTTQDGVPPSGVVTGRADSVRAGEAGDRLRSVWRCSSPCDHAGVRLGVVSDVGWDLRPTFAHHGLDHFFSAWVHSYEHDTEKPDRQLFHHACQEVAVDVAEALMVGDRPAKDGGAAAAGMRAYVLPAGAAPGAHRGLDAVLRLVETGTAHQV